MRMLAWLCMATMLAATDPGTAFRYTMACRDKLRLDLLNARRKVACLYRTASMNKRLLIALSQNDVPRLRQLLKFCLKQGRSVSAIMEKLAQAVEGCYKPKVCGTCMPQIAYRHGAAPRSELLMLLPQKRLQSCSPAPGLLTCAGHDPGRL
jgi:hypothetical protein